MLQWLGLYSLYGLSGLWDDQSGQYVSIVWNDMPILHPYWVQIWVQQLSINLLGV